MLGLYFLMFVAMSVISILGILLLFLLKSEQGKKAVFYFLVFWGHGDRGAWRHEPSPPIILQSS